jgi:hypothetical protein
MKKLSSYLTATLIALAGLGVLVFAVWFIVKFPMPHPLQPLKHRIVVALQLEKATEDKTVVLESQDLIIVRESPNDDSLKIAEIVSGSYRKIGKNNEWLLIEINDNQSGWVNQKFISQQ